MASCWGWGRGALLHSREPSLSQLFLHCIFILNLKVLGESQGLDLSLNPGDSTYYACYLEQITLFLCTFHFLVKTWESGVGI